MKVLFTWLRSVKAWMEAFAENKSALWILFAIAFVESSFFPFPPDILLIAIAVSQPKKALKAALVCTIGSVLGGAFGYLIGTQLMETVGNKIVEFYKAEEIWNVIVEKYTGEIGLWFLAISTFSPIPYKIATIAAGATKMDFPLFMLVSVIGRGSRFFLVAGLIYLVGPKMKVFIDKYFDYLSIAFVFLLVGGFVLVKYIL